MPDTKLVEKLRVFTKLKPEGWTLQAKHDKSERLKRIVMRWRNEGGDVLRLVAKEDRLTVFCNGEVQQWEEYNYQHPEVIDLFRSKEPGDVGFAKSE